MQLLKADYCLTRDSFSFFKNISSDNFLCFQFKSIQSSTRWQNELNWIYCFKAFTSEFKLRTNPVKAFNGMCVRVTSITFSVIWSSVLISVTRKWRYSGLFYKFFLINNIELKCSFACPVPKISQVMIKWRRQTSHLGRFTLWYNGRRTTPGLMHTPGVADIVQRQWQTMLKLWRLNPN